MRLPVEHRSGHGAVPSAGRNQGPVFRSGIPYMGAGGFFAFEYMEHEREEARFFGCLIMSLGALTGVAYAGNFVTLYLFLR